MSDPTPKPSEKITCPWCGNDATPIEARDIPSGRFLACGECENSFFVDHARLAVQHARLVEAVKQVNTFIQELTPTGSRHERCKVLNAAAIIDKALEEA